MTTVKIKPCYWDRLFNDEDEVQTDCMHTVSYEETIDYSHCPFCGRTIKRR